MSDTLSIDRHIEAKARHLAAQDALNIENDIKRAISKLGFANSPAADQIADLLPQLVREVDACKADHYRNSISEQLVEDAVEARLDIRDVWAGSVAEATAKEARHHIAIGEDGFVRGLTKAIGNPNADDHDPMRREHRTLADSEQSDIDALKAAAESIDRVLSVYEGPRFRVARERLEESVMWATKAITA